MKIAFRSAACDELTFQGAAELAGRCGFDGVELHAWNDSSVAPASNCLLKPPAEIREIFAAASVEISAMAIGNEVFALPQRIELAAEIKCRRIRLKSDLLFSRSGIITPRATDDLLAAGDIAAAFGISILIENQSTPGSAIRLWHLLDRLNHPAIGAAWDIAAAVAANDSPAVAIPTLNSRIQYVQSRLDDAALPTRKTIDRLRGIGFDGYVVVSNSGSPTQTASELEQLLIQACSTLQQWQIVPTTVS